MNNQIQQSVLLQKADAYARNIYRVTKKFPREELFGLTSQLRRAALSVPLNIIEGYARSSSREFCRFFRISYASLQESQYLVLFSHEEGYLRKQEYQELTDLGTEVAKMLWASLRTLRQKLS